MSRLISIGTASPPYEVEQVQILSFMHKAYADNSASRKLNVLFHSSGIKSRFSVLPDFSENVNGNGFFSGKQPDVSERLRLFNEKAVPLATEAIQNAVEKIGNTVSSMNFTHLITVSCTGIQAPGLDTMLLKILGLREDTFHTSLNFLGCNAAFPALKIADMIARTEINSRVLVVCVELCTLHFQPKNNNDNLLSNTLFGDGAAAFIVVPDEIAVVKKYHGLTINGFYSCLLDEGSEMMGWNISPLNFEMILDSGIPGFIGINIKKLMQNALHKLPIHSGTIDKWAIHPGGRKILDSIKRVLKLKDEEMETSYRILREFGNMSSPTILFILNEILNDDLTPGNTVFSIGFGPGISVDTTLFTYA
jgi:predicted naringenin-chalcone synthase